MTDFCLYLALYPALTTLDTESCVMPLAAKIKKVGILAETLTEKYLEG